ncbi:hypothetical protein E4P48_02440 [Porphyromonas levii]|uniref:Uncharacterized protein n=1 Tax=Porphyromonas levii TaxID=28114 RepID=A0A4Y8WPN9_9PORP|nr:hypothetical protein E4P47_05505 [Porphyromonas levii]TFH97125.1 hypothetical protein E4P48_02440 [Porphyromonas levii]
MKCKALRVRSEGSIPMYVTEPKVAHRQAESRKQRNNSPLCNSLLLDSIEHTAIYEIRKKFHMRIERISYENRKSII